MKPYQYVLVYQPKANAKSETVEHPRLLTDVPVLVLATDERTAALKAAKHIPAEFDECLDEIEVIIRPF